MKFNYKIVADVIHEYEAREHDAGSAIDNFRIADDPAQVRLFVRSMLDSCRTDFGWAMACIVNQIGDRLVVTPELRRAGAEVLGTKLALLESDASQEYRKACRRMRELHVQCLNDPPDRQVEPTLITTNTEP